MRHPVPLKYPPLQKTPTGFAPLFLASRGGHSSVVELLLDRGAEVERGNRDHNGGYGSSPLSAAALNGKLEVLEILLENGAKIDNPGGGMTPLHQVTIHRRGS